MALSLHHFWLCGMHQLSKDEQTTFPLGAELLRCDFYVDDLISLAKSKEEADIIMNQTSKILTREYFKLRKWCSNVTIILDGIADDVKESYLKFVIGT